MVFLGISIFLSSCSTQETSNYNLFAQCLTSNDATMYGTEWCSHCQDQKKLFGASFENINFIDCDKNSDICSKEGIKGYPTWKINEKSLVGKQSLSKLASVTGCELK